MKRFKKVYENNIEVETIHFKNKRGTRITIDSYHFLDGSWDDCTNVYARAIVNRRVRRKRRAIECISINSKYILFAFNDYFKILKEVLCCDRIARRWFRKNIGEVVVLDDIKMKDFILPSGELNYLKIKETEEIGRLRVAKIAEERRRKREMSNKLKKISNDEN